ncbi:hypothetical protein FHX09_005922 [Rhizobium sp. BK538]|nr:hypothetical protein [Rhizobium sp. BK538]
MEHAKLMQSIELYGSKVIPLVRTWLGAISEGISLADTRPSWVCRCRR